MMRRGRLVLDVSNNNTINAFELKRSGAVALVAKETEGTSFRDGTAAQHRAIANMARVPFGGYLFLHLAAPRQEADDYLAYAGLRPGDIQPIIDAEVTDGRTVTQAASAVQECALELEGHGYRPILYASSSFWLGLIAADPRLRRLHVWEADYPGRFTRWFPSLAARRIRLRHGVTVVLWQWTPEYAVGARRFDASRLMGPLARLRIPA